MVNVDRGPIDQHGNYDPEKATISWLEVKKRGWLKNSRKVPWFWRRAVEKALIQYLEDSRRRDMERSFGSANGRSEAVREIRRQRMWQDLNKQ